MKQTSSMLRKFFVLTFLAFGLLIVSMDTGVCVGASSCDDAFNAYLNGENSYYTSFNLYHYNDPTTCDEDCDHLTGNEYTECVSNCEITRYTSLGNAQIGLFSLALDTCTPISLDGCAQARARRDDCIAQFYPFGSDPVEADRRSTQYAACLEASKVSSCE